MTNIKAKICLNLGFEETGVTGIGPVFKLNVPGEVRPQVTWVIV